MAKTTVSTISYAEAMAEIEKILSDMNTATLNIDSLAQNVARANELLDICKSKLLKAQTEVEKVLASSKQE